MQVGPAHRLILDEKVCARFSGGSEQTAFPRRTCSPCGPPALLCPPVPWETETVPCSCFGSGPDSKRSQSSSYVTWDFRIQVGEKKGGRVVFTFRPCPEPQTSL